jgi:quercetin dioxygenase-like cupin family protein
MPDRLTKTIAAAALATALLGPTVSLGDAARTPLLKTELHGMEGMEANMVLLEGGPGFQTERHTHSGHVFVYVLEGAIELHFDGQEPVRVSAGEAAYELPNHAMVGRNVSSTEGVRAVVFQIGKAGEPLTAIVPE